jgi:hypothetical protein
MKKNLPIIIMLILTLCVCVTATIGYSTDNTKLMIISNIGGFFWNIAILYFWLRAERSKEKHQLNAEILETLNESPRTEDSGA